AQARQLLARPDGDAEAALKLAQRALDAAGAFPERAGEAALLAGSAHIRLAERADPLPGARLAWQQARELLEQAERSRVPDDDQAALMYRLAKVGYHTGADQPDGIAPLEEGGPRRDSPAEGYALLTQAYLRL